MLSEFAGKPVLTPQLEKNIPTVLLAQSEFLLMEKPPVGKFGKFCLNTNTSEEALSFKWEMELPIMILELVVLLEPRKFSD